LYLAMHESIILLFNFHWYINKWKKLKMQRIISKDLFHIIHALKYNIFDLLWLFIKFKTCIAYIHMQTITNDCVCKHNNVWTTIRYCASNNSKSIRNNTKNVFLEGVILWIHKINNISYPWWMKMYIYSNLNAMIQFQSMTYQKVWKPFVVYLYSFVINVFVFVLISFFMKMTWITLYMMIPPTAQFK